MLGKNGLLNAKGSVRTKYTRETRGENMRLAASFVYIIVTIDMVIDYQVGITQTVN